MFASSVIGFVGACALAGPASALVLGPVSLPVPVTVPPVVAAPVAGATSAVLPHLGVAVTASPSTGVKVGVTLPTAIGPVPLPTAAAPPVQVRVGGDGAGTTTVATTPARAHAAPSSSRPTTSAAARDATTSAANATAAALHNLDVNVRNTPASQTATRLGPHGAVDASLTTPRAESTLGFLLRNAANHALWLALLAILALARWALMGLVRDARQRHRLVTSG